jgi:GT2 family glycosyltransferase
LDPSVSVIILNWNGWLDTVKCLESLFQITYSNFSVVVLDNGSSDGSVERIKAWAEGRLTVESDLLEYNNRNKPVNHAEYKREKVDVEEHVGGVQRREENRKMLVIIRNEKNYGFSEGNNIGARYALRTWNPDYIYFLNNDTVVEKGFLKTIIEFAQRNHHDVGALQSKLMIMDDIRRIDCAGGFVTRIGGGWDRGWGEIDKGQYDKDIDIFYAKGAALMIRSDIAKRTGLFDPKYVIYYDDSDLCWRVRLNGYRVLLCPKSIVYHKGMGTMKKQPSPQTLFTSKKNQISMLAKNYSRGNLLRNLTRLFVRDVIRRTVSILFKNTIIPALRHQKRGRNLAELGPILHAYLWNVAHLRYIWKARLRSQRIIRKVADSVLPFREPA